MNVEKIPHLLNVKSNRSKTRTGPVLLRMMRGWPPSRQKTPPVIAVPRKLSNTPWKYGEQLENNSHECKESKQLRSQSDLHVFCSISQQTTERDGVCHSSEVNKQNGRQGLNVKCICEVTEEERRFSFNVKYETTTKPAGRDTEDVLLVQYVM